MINLKKQARRSKNKKDRGIEEEQNNLKKVKHGKKDRTPKEIKKSKKIKFIIFIFIVILIISLGIWIGITTHTWKTLAQDMILNEFSTVKACH